MTRRTRILGELLAHDGGLMVRDLYRSHARWPARGEHPPGAVVEARLEREEGHEIAEVLAVRAASGTGRAALYRIFAAADIDPLFPDAVLAEAERAVAHPGTDDPALVDLTALPFVTIDNEDSRDLDQALFVEAGQGEAAWVVHYALADASYYVRPDTALFAEALRRGTSYYLPHLAVPMLPRSLSEGIVSLNPDVVRRALVVSTALDAQGRILETNVRRARILSQAKLSYNGVQRYFDAPAESPIAGAPWERSLQLMREVGERRISQARARDVVAYNRVAVEIGLNDGAAGQGEHPLTFTARGEVRNDVEKWNEQLSLLCNMEGARILAESHEAPHVQAVFRVHPSPTRDALTALARTIDAIVETHGLDADAWRWRPRSLFGDEGESLADYIDRLPTDGPHHRIRQAIERQAMYAGEASTYSVERGPHWGVGAEGYSRLSAPMREIVGIFTHKELLEALGDPKDARDSARDEQLRLQVVAAGNRARTIQRNIDKAANKLVIDQLLGADLDRPAGERPWRAGTLLGVKASRLYIELDEPPIEVKVYADYLKTQLSGELALGDSNVSARCDGTAFALGDAVKLRVDHLDKAHDRWVFTVERLPGPET